MRLPGPMHDIKVKYVSQRTLNKDAGANEEVRADYSVDDNLIRVRRDLSEEEQLHLLLHEWAHAIEAQMELCADEESRVNVMAVFLRQTFNIKSQKELLRASNRNRSRNR